MTKNKRERKTKETASQNLMSELHTIVLQNRDVLCKLTKVLQDSTSRLDALEVKVDVLSTRVESHEENMDSSVTSQYNDIGLRFDNVSNLINKFVSSQETYTTAELTSQKGVKLEECDVLNRLQNLEYAIKRIEESTLRKENKLRAENFKKDNQILWSDTMNARKRSFWKYMQNKSKEELYRSWIQESPEYLPLKYRPRVNPTDDEKVIQQKITSSRQKYAEDITLMASYAEGHAQKTASLDTVIAEEAHRLEIDEVTRQEISTLWKEETD